MTKIIGIRFRNAGKVYYFDPKDLELRHGDTVIVETASGPECGKVVLSVREVPDEKVIKPLRPVLRKADEQDLEREQEIREKEKDAYRICREKIRAHGLDMKLVKAEYAFDGKKITFYFTADGRVDFRELVRDLASVFRTRIELRQIGVRDETRLLGGIGICGRQLCCASYLTDFVPVSIKMAKEQNLSLNPGKISGVCGRLMCCLKNEEETYEYLNRNLPGVGDVVETPDERSGTVSSVNVLRQSVRVLIEEGDEKDMEEYPASDLTLIAKRKKGGRLQPAKKPAASQDRKAEDAGDQKQESSSGDKQSRQDRRHAPSGDGEDRAQGGAEAEKDETKAGGRSGRSRGRGRRRRQNPQGADTDAGKKENTGSGQDRKPGEKNTSSGRNRNGAEGAKNVKEGPAVRDGGTQQSGETPREGGEAAGEAAAEAPKRRHRSHRRRHRSNAANNGGSDSRNDGGSANAGDNGSNGGSGSPET